jgi:hypothetical protein
MEPVSQNGRRKARPWTAQDQIVAEVAAACGVTCAEIGRVLGRSSSLVRHRLIAEAAAKKREAVRRWKKENSEKICEQGRIYRAANPDRIREYGQRWRKNNADKERERCRSYYQANKDRARENGRRWAARNPQKCRESVRRWQADNSDRLREITRRRNALKRAARRHSLLPVTQQQINARFNLWNNRCAFCGVDAAHQRNCGYQRLTVEHVLALTKGGLDEASNIIPSCKACNSSKHVFPAEAWYKRQPFFTAARWAKIQRYCSAAAAGQLPLALPPPPP